ncbi:PilW family protein [Piscinibacter sakaiensis]
MCWSRPSANPSPERRRAACRPGARARRARGLSLIELMIGIVIGLVLITFMIRGFAASSGNSAVNSLVSEYQTNGRYAQETLSREIRHAALSPLLWDASQIEVTPAAAARNFGCGAGVTTLVRQGLAASNDSNPYSGNCLAAASDRQYARGDVLTLRRLGSSTTASFSSNAPYARTSYAAGRIFLGGETPPTPLPPFFDYPALSDVYFINEFTNSPTESPKVPALYRLTLSAGANPVMVPELVASNVEHLQLQFGVVDGSGNVRYFNPDGVTDWTAVTSVRLWLLLRASEPEAGMTSDSYTMADVTYTPGDRFRRLVLTSTIQVRNR